MVRGPSPPLPIPSPLLRGFLGHLINPTPLLLPLPPRGGPGQVSPLLASSCRKWWPKSVLPKLHMPPFLYIELFSLKTLKISLALSNNIYKYHSLNVSVIISTILLKERIIGIRNAHVSITLQVNGTLGDRQGLPHQSPGVHILFKLIAALSIGFCVCVYEGTSPSKTTCKNHTEFSFSPSLCSNLVKGALTPCTDGLASRRDF